MSAALPYLFTGAAVFAVASLSYSFAELARAWPIVRRAYLLATLEA